MTSNSNAQNVTQEVQMVKQVNPTVKIQIVESPNDGDHVSNNNRVQIMTIEKSDTMEIVKAVDIQANSKTVPANKTTVIRKEKSDKIDQ
jgi:hypothetical protein